MTRSPDQSQRIAPAVPSLQSSDRRPGGSSPGPDAALNNPEQHPSLPAGGRSLMGGCATRRQTRAQGGTRVLFIYRAIRSTRHFIQLQMGTDTALGRRLGMCRLALAVGENRGIGRRANAFHAINHSSLKSHFQCVSEANPGHFRNSSSNAPTTSWKRFADEQKPIAAGVQID